MSRLLRATFSNTVFASVIRRLTGPAGRAGSGTEFPILPFLAAICYKFAGIHEWIGRSQSVIFFAISLPFFFLLVREILGGTRPELWATFFYAFAPLNIGAGRSFMPDSPSLSLGIIGLYLFLVGFAIQSRRRFIYLRLRFPCRYSSRPPASSLFTPFSVAFVAGAPTSPCCNVVTSGAVPVNACGYNWQCLPPLRFYLRSHGIGTRIKSPGDIIPIILAPVD